MEKTTPPTSSCGASLATPPLTESQCQVVNEALNLLSASPGALLPVLHHIQKVLRFVPPAAIPQIARTLNQSEADVHGTMSFYHEFRNSPPGATVIQVCRAESCQSMGSLALEAYVRSRLGIDFHQTTRDNNFTLEPVYCLGNCMNSPSIRVEDEIHGDMNAARFDALVEGCLTQVIEVKAP
ncbi:formate dehydrogenase subunit gamma [Enterovibrio norvegicus]|uniref:NADH-quinone oxidoreductase subunit E n=1 Tax=Enterovibrio norvegicus TaxID=188144 RepID=A0ABV4L918_9GAMM|nr:formate dehydrogenase subunit gamma [Enterovibrio norvegicus]OEF56579.1 formate dehydrogenase subunit gamma [Enterovibrio norvegicus]